MGRIKGDLVERSFNFARLILRHVDELPSSMKARELGRQFLRSGTGVGANIREADHAITDREFAQKCSFARKEASETLYWLQLCRSDKLLEGAVVDQAVGEADELTRVLVTIVRATQQRLKE